MTRDCLGQGGFVAVDADFSVIDLDFGDDGLQVGLARLDIGAVEALAHHCGQCGEPLRGDCGPCLCLDGEAIQGCFGDGPLGLECADPVLQLSIELDDTVLDGSVEAGYLLVLGRDLRIDTVAPVGSGRIPDAFALDERLEDVFKALGSEEPLLKIADDKLVELVRRQRL